MVDIASRLKRALKDVIVCKQLSNCLAGKLDLSLSVTIVDNETWETMGYEGIYNTLKFDQATNWGDWLSINPLKPTGNPDPSTYTEAGEEEEGEEEEEEGEEGEGEEGEGEEGEGEEVDLILELVLEIIRNR